MVRAAEELAPCHLDGHWGGTIVFHDGPFPCAGAGGYTGLCEGISDLHRMDIDGSQGAGDVLKTTLPWELANEQGMSCYPVNYVEGQGTAERAALITELAEKLIANLPQ